MIARVTLILRRLIPAGPRPADGQRRHRAMFAVDIAGFSSRAPHHQVLLRKVLYRIVQGACDTAGLPWRDCHHEDRGDGILVIAHTDVDFEILLNPLARQIGDALRTHNRAASSQTQIQLRMSVHAGYVQPDDHGVVGPDVIHLFRLLNAPALKTSLATHYSDLALIVSDYLYNIATGYGLINPSHYQPITIKLKDTDTQAWIRI